MKSVRKVTISYSVSVFLLLLLVVAEFCEANDDGEMVVPRGPRIKNQFETEKLNYTFGDEVEDLICEIEIGAPTPTVAWFKDGKRLFRDEIYDLEYDVKIGKAKLEFKDAAVVGPKISGNYSCVAANFLGRAIKNYSISVVTLNYFVVPNLGKHSNQTIIK